MLASIGIVCVAVHLVFVHRGRPGSITGQSDLGSVLMDVLLKDGLLVCGSSGALIIVAMRALVHPDNWDYYDMLRTPAHIEPEPYFL